MNSSSLGWSPSAKAVCVRLREDYAAPAEAIANLLCAMQAVDAELSSIGEIECEPLVRGYPTVRRYWTERKAPHGLPPVDVEWRVR